MYNYAQNAEPTQRERLDSRQVENNAGGFVYGIDLWARFQRWLVLGSEGSTYYQTARELTLKNSRVIDECIDEDPKKLLAVLVEQRTLPKHDTAIYALARLVAKSPGAVSQESFNAIIRTGTHLFQFVQMATGLRGWGRSLRRLVRSWYVSKDLRALEYQCAKYRNRANWTHRDVLKCCHLYVPNSSTETAGLIRFLRTGENLPSDLPLFQVTSQMPEKDIIRRIEEHSLTHEMIPSEKRTPTVWGALAQRMPIGALVRNLGNLSQKGVIGPGMWEENEKIVSILKNKEAVHKSRIHPISILLAAKTYESGHGFRGKLSWNTSPDVIDALGKAFHLSFDNVLITGKRFMLACDVSGSMWYGDIAGTNVTPAEATAAMAMVALREPKCLIYAFDTKFREVHLTKNSTLGDSQRALRSRTFGATDCSLPMRFALKNRIPIDVFCVYTDNETWAGRVHPMRALQEYRRCVNPNAKLVVVGMTSTGFSIADPNDPGTLDVVGFDVAVPRIIADFAAAQPVVAS